MEGKSASKKLRNLLADSGKAKCKGRVSWYLLSAITGDVFVPWRIFHCQEQDAFTLEREVAFPVLMHLTVFCQK